MNLQYKHFSFDVQETKQVEREGLNLGIIKGFGATFGASTGEFDRSNQTFAKEAFDESIAQHKSRHNRPIRMLFQHNRNQLIGGFPIDDVRITEKGIHLIGEINLDVIKGFEAFKLAKQGVLRDMSIGFSVRDILKLEDGSEIIQKAEIFEFSLVDEPMDMNSVITDVKTFDIEQVQEIKTKREFEKLMREAGFSQKAAKCLTASYSEQRDDVGEEEAEELKSLEADKAALAAIREALASFK